MILFVSSCCKSLKTNRSGETCTCATCAKPFLLNAHPQSDLCLLLLNLEMSITISNLGFIWKFKRYASKSQNNTTINQIILKTLT